jgi:phage tail-like protein
MTTTKTIPPTQVSSYLDYLPAIFQENAGADGATFLGRFLLAFESVLSGLGNNDPVGLEETIDRFATYLDPDQAPKDFLPWLANWVALTVWGNWDEAATRRFIEQVVSLYRQRGTPAGMEAMLRAYTGVTRAQDQYAMTIAIDDVQAPMQVGCTCTVGVDTVLDGGRPFYFVVRLKLPIADPTLLDHQRKLVQAIVDQEKPAHTYYELDISAPTMQIGKASTVGVDTLLGTETAHEETSDD